ncbi:hypothetical protein [Erythrobacter sp. F6033]|uniref:hypothetical protein n=1 Tax=Erythrobacter sp. F6033 TaxID=2926401 RepID=UPI001FF50076|nr:hypothetical protein [Erythrobacter sp. F6033]MCK0129824.1 hypothetical protein [Erythrobacter sp. F6033]
MAKSSTPRSSSRIALWLLLIIAAAIAAALYAYRAPIGGYADVGTSYAARVACSCRFVAGRTMEDCEKDKLGGMELVTLSDDVEAKSVTARFPLVTSNTATFREGYGCVLEKWEG